MKLVLSYWQVLAEGIMTHLNASAPSAHDKTLARVSSSPQMDPSRSQLCPAIGSWRDSIWGRRSPATREDQTLLRQAIIAVTHPQSWTS